MTIKTLFSNCSLNLVLLCFVVSASAENFATVKEILVPGQSSVFDVQFEDPKQQQKGKNTS
jgi:hypothetical protein